MPNQYVQFTARKDYFGGEPKIHTIYFKVGLSAETAEAQLSSGELDLALSLSSDSAPQLEKVDGLTTKFVNSPAAQLIQFRVDNPLAANVKDVGTLAETYTPDGPPLTVIGDADGGALVVGSMSTVSTVTVTLGGAKLALSPFESAAAGASEAGKSLTRTYTDVLVFHVPAAGSGKQVQLIAAESVLTAVAAQ